MRLYRYIGPPEIRAAFESTTLPYATARQCVTSSDDVSAWCEQHCRAIAQPTLTFIVDEGGALWIVDRHSEHVACARGGCVRAAGEITFELGSSVSVSEVSNQSTGYCPEPTSYSALATALASADVPHPAIYTRAFDFRRCEVCGLLNVVKDEDFVCAECQSPLNVEWNCDIMAL